MNAEAFRPYPARAAGTCLISYVYGTTLTGEREANFLKSPSKVVNAKKKQVRSARETFSNQNKVVTAKRNLDRSAHEAISAQSHMVTCKENCIPSDPDQLALTLNSKKRNLHKNGFLSFAENAGIPRNAAGRMLARIYGLKDRYLALCAESYLPKEMKERLASLIEQRCKAFD